jgi:hypothetical protein
MGFRRDPRQSRRANFASTAFTPKALANLTLWLRADLGITGGASPTTWADQSGQGNSVTGGGSGITWSASAGPQSTAVVQLSGPATQTLANTNTPVTGTACTIYIVHKISVASTNANPFILGSATPVKLGWTLASLRNFTLGANTQTGGSDSTSYELWIYQTTSGGTQSLRVNGASVSLSGNIAAVTPDANFTLTTAGIGGGQTWSIAEIAISNSVPGASDVANFEAYALARYGL